MAACPSDDCPLGMLMSNRARSKGFVRLGRRGATRAAAERILIVCEGEKTEPRYLRDLLADLKLTNADVIVSGGECGSDPGSIAEYAVERASVDQGLDRVYCVVDRDEHKTRPQAITTISKANKSKPPEYEIVESVPCFEYWVLLHFEESAKPYARTGNKSICDCCVEDVRRHIVDYAKGSKGIYSQIRANQLTALRRAIRRKAALVNEGGDNPSTDLPTLIAKLILISPGAETHEAIEVCRTV